MKTVYIRVETDHPNPEGLAAVAANELYTRLTNKPRYSTEIETSVFSSSLGARPSAKRISHHLQVGE